MTHTFVCGEYTIATGDEDGNTPGAAPRTMNTIQYDLIGENYNANRTADHRIVDSIIELLDLPAGSVIADVGAGTGNYSNALAGFGYSMLAIEPSAVMLAQRSPHEKVHWVRGVAEFVPLNDNPVDGVIAVLAIHHFSSMQAAALEFRRICPYGPMVVLTYDPRYGKGFWFNDYFPEIYRRELRIFPPVEQVAEILNTGKGSTTVREFPLPCDLLDKNMHSGWNRPEIYLDERMRSNTSGFALADPSTVRKGINRLADDLQSGLWDLKYGWLRERVYLDTGFRFIKITARECRPQP